jgi:hypothetical protein
MRRFGCSCQLGKIYKIDKDVMKSCHEAREILLVFSGFLSIPALLPFIHNEKSLTVP